MYSISMKTTVSARRISRNIEATIKLINRKLARMTEAERLCAVQLLANIDDPAAFDSISRNCFVSTGSL